MHMCFYFQLKRGKYYFGNFRVHQQSECCETEAIHGYPDCAWLLVTDYITSTSTDKNISFSSSIWSLQTCDIYANIGTALPPEQACIKEATHSCIRTYIFELSPCTSCRLNLFLIPFPALCSNFSLLKCSMKYQTFRKSLAAERAANAKNSTTILRIQQLQRTAGPLEPEPTEIKTRFFPPTINDWIGPQNSRNHACCWNKTVTHLLT